MKSNYLIMYVFIAATFTAMILSYNTNKFWMGAIGFICSLASLFLIRYATSLSKK